MTATIHPFPVIARPIPADAPQCCRNDGPGNAVTARDAFIGIALEMPYPNITLAIATVFADYVMAELRIKGFVAVPASDKVTR